jgi:hypothetical protein
MLGRVRHLPDLTSRDNAKRSQAERQAVNSIIQGSASDIIKFAMLATERAVDRWMAGGGGRGGRPRVVMQIHDELVYDVSNESEDGMEDVLALSASCRMFVHLLKQCMEGEVMRSLRVSVPLITTVRVGCSWGHLKPFDTIHDDSSVSPVVAPTVVDVSTSGIMTRRNGIQDRDTGGCCVKKNGDGGTFVAQQEQEGERENGKMIVLPPAPRSKQYIMGCDGNGEGRRSID